MKIIYKRARCSFSALFLCDIIETGKIIGAPSHPIYLNYVKALVGTSPELFIYKGGVKLIEKIRLRKKKNEVVKVGDVVNYRGSIFIILNVLAVRVMINRENGELMTMSDCLGQQYRTPDLSADYITTQAEITYEPEEFRKISVVGEYIYDQETGIWVQIKAILGYHFEGRNLVVKYEFEPVMELPVDEVEKAIAKKRKSIMKLVKKNS